MSSQCSICGKPATLFALVDPFGKSDAMKGYCSEHAPAVGFGNPVTAPLMGEEYWKDAHTTMMFVESNLRHCCRELIQMVGTIPPGPLRQILYGYDLVTPEGRLYIPDSVSNSGAQS